MNLTQLYNFFTTNMKKTLLLILGLVLTTSLFAGPVGKEEAKEKALAFLNGNVGTKDGVAKAPRHQQDLSLATTGDAYHVFNIGAGNGFVIVSGSDLTPDIIGYTDEGSFNPQSLPDNMKAWLQGYADQIEWVEKNGEPAASESVMRKAPADVKTPIAALTSTKWGQGAPYNFEVPSGCLTGCVATAMAQALYYCNQNEGFPTATTKEIPDYDDGNGHPVPACDITTFAWDKMLKTYTGSETTTDPEAMAVATLMEYCGASVKMKYGTGASSATTMHIAEALKTYFGFDDHLRNIYRTQYTNAEWEDIIYQELAASRPVIYGGQSSGGGHAFICDGYDADGYFHINWGWGGLHNGYYLLSVVNPDKGGAGSGSSADGYAMEQDALIGIQAPASGATAEDAVLTCQSFEYTGAEEVLRSSSPFSFNYKLGFKSELTYTYNFQLGIGVYNESDDLVANAMYTDPNEVMPNMTMSFSGWITFPLTTFPDGKVYTIKPIIKVSEGNYIALKGTDGNYVQVTGEASKIVLKNKTPDYKLTASDVQLTTDGVANSAQTIIAKIKNTGTAPYRSILYLFASGTKVSGTDVNVEPGETVLASFSYKPTAPGTPVLKITTDEAGTKSITIDGGYTFAFTSGGADNVDLTVVAKESSMVDDSGWKFLGKKAKVTVNVKNTNATPYVGSISFVLWRKSDPSTYLEVNKGLTLLAGADTDITFECDLEEGESYKPTIYYIKSDSYKHAINIKENKYYPIAKVIKAIAADGTEVPTLPAATYVVPDNAAAVDMRDLSTIPEITLNSNPNCLYVLASSATVPAKLADKNVVKGTTADNIVLTDGYDFYSPVDFIATKISYTRTFAKGADGSGNGWSTIMLPFNVATVKQGTTPIDWFKSSTDSGKNFWVYQFYMDGKGTVNFDYAPSIMANTPYLITVPSDHWGAEFDLTDKAITFEATDVVIKSNEKNTQSGFYYMFTGGSQKQAVTDAYVMNTDGNKFAKTTGDVPAFQAYFYPSSHNLQTDALAIGFVGGSEEVTGIVELKDGKVEELKSDDVWYTINGVKLTGEPTEKGVYIHNGRKYIIQ